MKNLNNLSTEAKETALLMIEHCLSARHCMGMGEGTEPHKLHHELDILEPHIKELADAIGYTIQDDSALVAELGERKCPCCGSDMIRDRLAYQTTYSSEIYCPNGCTTEPYWSFYEVYSPATMNFSEYFASAKKLTSKKEIIAHAKRLNLLDDDDAKNSSLAVEVPFDEAEKYFSQMHHLEGILG